MEETAGAVPPSALIRQYQDFPGCTMVLGKVKKLLLTFSLITGFVIRELSATSTSQEDASRSCTHKSRWLDDSV
jgi:hypothetical protein